MAQFKKSDVVRTTYLLIFLATVLSLGSACKSEATKQAEERALATTKLAEEQTLAAKKQQDELALLQQAEERLQAEKALKEARLKARILSSPNEFLQVGDLAAIDNGIFSSDRQLTKMTVTNRTAYPLTGFSGEVHWMSDKNEVREITLFKLGGSLSPGDTKTFTTGDGSLDTGTTVSHAHKYEVSFKQVKFLEVAQ